MTAGSGAVVHPDSDAAAISVKAAYSLVLIEPPPSCRLDAGYGRSLLWSTAVLSEATPLHRRAGRSSVRMDAQ